MDLQLLIDCLTIVLIDLLLAGDNAVVIALAVKSLPPKERKLGIAVGSGLAVVLRVALTFFAAQLLLVPFVKLAGGVLVLWIAVKLLTENEEDVSGKRARSLWHAMWLILVADVTMSADNILAVAGTSKGNLWLLIFGLGLSIPFVVFTSNLLARVMDRFPWVVWLGSAILGRVGADMIMSDPYVEKTLAPSLALSIAVQAICAIGVLLVGKALIPKHELPSPPGHAEERNPTEAPPRSR